MDDKNPYEPPQAEADQFKSRQANTGYRDPCLVVAVGFATGYFVWASSRMLTGHDEPWDSGTGFYLFTMNLGALLAGAIGHRWWSLAFFALWIGQCAALLTITWLREAGWFHLAVVTTGFGTIMAIPGLAIGALIHKVIIDKVRAHS